MRSYLKKKKQFSIFYLIFLLEIKFNYIIYNMEFCNVTNNTRKTNKNMEITLENVDFGTINTETRYFYDIFQ